MIRIFNIYHKTNQIRNSCFPPMYIPLTVNNELNENISQKYSYAEMRGHYWVWKNLNKRKALFEDVEYIGFQHYRRYLDLRHFNGHNDGLIFTNDHNLFELYLSEIKRDSELFSERDLWRGFHRVFGGYDVIVPRAWEFPMRIGEQYGVAHNHVHWRTLLDLQPEFESLAADEFRYNVCNIFVMRRREFEKYMSFWWELIQKIENKIEIPGAEDYQSRALGFLSERIFSLWLKREKGIRPELKVAEVPLIMDLTPE